MNDHYSKEEERLIEVWLQHPGFRAVVEADLGEGFKTIVSLSGGMVKFQGPKGAKAIAIAHILQGAEELEKLAKEEAEKPGIEQSP